MDFPNKTIIEDSSVSSWSLQPPCSVGLGRIYTTWEESVDGQQTAINAELSNTNKIHLNNSIKFLKEFCNRPSVLKYSDTTVGGSDVFNPYWQFNVNDDIAHPVFKRATNDENSLGRVYAETYEDNQQVLYLCFGVPKYAGWSAFHATFGAATEYAENVISGNLGLFRAVTQGLKTAFITAFEIALFPIRFMSMILNIGLSDRQTGYYAFYNTMPEYYTTVNGILNQIATAMGLYDTDATFEAKAYNENTKPALTKYSALPEIFKDGHFDIFSTIMKRGHYTGKNINISTNGEDAQNVNSTADIPTLPDLINQAKNQDASSTFGFFEKHFGGVYDYWTGLGNYVGFRVEKSTDAGESFQNQYGESALAGRLNGEAASAYEVKIERQGGRMFGGVEQYVHEISQELKGLIFGNESASIKIGNGYYSIPEVWKNSSWSKSHSINIILRSRLGDPVSIFQSLWIPYALILAGVLPRSIGVNSYTAPYLCQGYCKGFFSLPLAAIESVSVQRGDSEYGWNREQLPLTLRLSIQIRDLSPIMHMSTPPGGSWILPRFSYLAKTIFSKNDTLQDYLSTISGAGLRERTYGWSRLKQRLKSFWANYKDNTLLFNSAYRQLYVANSRLGSLLGGCVPGSTLTNNNTTYSRMSLMENTPTTTRAKPYASEINDDLPK